jgi:hypothetical protein
LVKKSPKLKEMGYAALVLSAAGNVFGNPEPKTAFGLVGTPYFSRPCQGVYSQGEARKTPGPRDGHPPYRVSLLPFCTSTHRTDPGGI